MSIRFACPTCQTTYTVRDHDAGKKSECKNCSQRVQVPFPTRAKTVLGEVLPLAEDDTVQSSWQLSSPPSLPVAKFAPDYDLVDHDLASPGEMQVTASNSQSSLHQLPPIPKSRRKRFPVMVALTGAALLVALVYLIREFGDSGLAYLFSTDHDADLLAWVPPDTESVTGLKMGELNSHPEIKAVFMDMEPRKDGRIGFTMESVERMLVVGRINKDSKQDLLFVFRLNRTFDPNTLIKSGLATQKKRGNKSYLEFANADRLYNPTGEVVLFSNNESLF